MKLEITSQTTLAHVNDFLSKNGDTGKLRGEVVNGKTYIYISQKGSGTGAKNHLFGVVNRRRDIARQALMHVLEGAGGPLGLRVDDEHSAAFCQDIHVGSLRPKLTEALQAHGPRLLLPQLPAGLKIENGILSGTSKFMNVPNIAGKDVAPFRGQSVAKLFEHLRPKKLAIIQVDGEPLPVGSQATRDFFRLDYDIDNGGVHFKSLEDIESDDEATRNAAMGKALLDFADGDALTVEVLSGLLTQQVPTALLACMGDAFNSSTETARKPDFRILTAFNVFDANASDAKVFKAPDQFADASTAGLGSTKFNLSKTTDGNIKVSISWTPSFLGVKDGSVKLKAGEALSLQFDVDVIVNADQARTGVLSVEVPDGLRVQYSGRLDG